MNLELLITTFNRRRFEGIYSLNGDFHPNNYTTHSVRSGDTLWDLAQTRQGLTAEYLAVFNGVSDPRTLGIGTPIKIPTQTQIDFNIRARAGGLHLFAQLDYSQRTGQPMQAAQQGHRYPTGMHVGAASKGYYGVMVTPNGGATFAGSRYLHRVGADQRNIVMIQLTGSRRDDFRMANAISGIPVPKGADAPRGYTWHHVDDYNRRTGTATLELVRTTAHKAAGFHRGSVWQYEQHTGSRYRR